VKSTSILGLLMLTAAMCRFGDDKPVDTQDTGGDTDPADSPGDSVPDSTVDTWTGASDTQDTGDEPVEPETQLILLDDARALFVGQAWAVDCGEVVAGVGDIDADGVPDIGLGDPDAEWDNGGSGAAVFFSGATVSGTMNMLSDYDLRLEALGYNEGAGAALTMAGDVDGDGYDDLAMTSLSAWYNGYDPDDGQLHLWYGPPDKGVTELDTADSDANVSLNVTGVSVMDGGGDVDGDGLADLVVGMAEHDDHRGGVAWVFIGPDLTTWSTITGADADRCGTSVAMAGDVDGDGYDDVLIGAPQDGPSAANLAAGYAGVLQGSAIGPGPTRLGSAWVRVVGTRGHERATGYAVAGLGDFEGDGQADLAVAATDRDKASEWTGELAALVRGADVSDGGMFTMDDAHATFATDQRGSVHSRISLAGPLDFDGDSLMDFVVGAPGHQSESGATYVYLAAWLGESGERGPDDAHYQLIGADQGAFGAAMDVVGDIDGDGRDELLVGGPNYDTAGAAALFGVLE